MNKTDRAQSIIDYANQCAHEYIKRIATDPAAPCAVEARLGYEVGQLHRVIRTLCVELEIAKAACAQRDERLAEAGLIESDDEDDAADRAAFVRSTGAADILRRAA